MRTSPASAASCPARSAAPHVVSPTPSAWPATRLPDRASSLDSAAGSPARAQRPGRAEELVRSPAAPPAQGGTRSNVKVILTKDVAKLGKSGEMKAVADGFATNYLIPQKLAVPAAGGAYRAWQHDIASREDKRARERSEAEVTANRSASTTLTRGVKVGDAGKLYGSIGSKEIAEALGRRGIVVDRHKVELEEPLKSLGTYKVAVKVFAGLTPEVTVVVEPKG